MCILWLRYRSWSSKASTSSAGAGRGAEGAQGTHQTTGGARPGVFPQWLWALRVLKVEHGVVVVVVVATVSGNMLVQASRAGRHNECVANEWFM